MQVGIVPHTHWDREWYAPFQTMRVRLVRLLDELLDLLEHDPSYTRFLLDGQTAVVDDYLEIRPDAAPRIERLARAGRVQLGPWMVLMDELMVSGETIVRDLQLGLARASQLGGAMAIGYLPDMFGHVAQMPQILRLAGLEHAVVWRGVPAEITKTAFWWEAPDGSRVRAEYLYGSYSNGRDLPDDAELLVARAHGYALELGPARLDGGGMLLMNGTDHQLPQPWLGRVVAAANLAQDDYRFEITSLPQYLARQPVDVLATWRGELRSGARANVLMGVASNRVDVHQGAAAAERAVERRAEPLSALFLPADEYPHALLGVAWKNLVLNSAHDSACACSHDDVVDAVVVRYEEARHVGDALATEALHALGAQVDAPAGSIVVVNTAARDRSGMIEVTTPGPGDVHLVDDDGRACPTQLVGISTGESLSTVVTGQKVRWIVEMMRGPELGGTRIARVEEHRPPDGVVEMVFDGAGPDDVALDLEAARERLLALGDAGETVRVRVRRAPESLLLATVDQVPSFGWRTCRVAPGAGPSTGVRTDGLTIENEHVVVALSPSRGTFTMTADGVTVRGANRYVDGGDGGDTYNYSPPARDSLADRPDEVEIAALESGPVRARLLVTSTHHWPADAIGDARSCSARSNETVKVDVRTTLELRTGERFLRVHVELDNRARDHRLRAHFPLPAPVTGSDAECAFAVVHRGLAAEGGPGEAGLPTFVSRRFVDCSAAGDDGLVGFALLHDGLLEYEVVDSGRELALTLLRATGYLSRLEPSLRPNPAGPPDPLEGPQLQRRLALDYALMPHRGDWRDARLHAAADDFLVPLEATRGGAWPGAHRARRGSALTVEGAQVSAVLRDAATGALLVRLCNASPEPSKVRIALGGSPAAGRIVDLCGDARAPFDGSTTLRAWEIATFQLD